MSKFIQIAVVKLVEDAVVPKYMHVGDSGCDLYSIEDATIQPFEIKLVGTGISMSIPEGAEGQVRPRSGWAIKHGLTVVNTPGTIDSNYRGEIKVGLINLSKEAIHINKKDRIAQLVIVPVFRGVFNEVGSLSISDRQDGGFGHTGVK